MPQLWTASQRGVVIGIVIALLGCLAVQSWLNPVDVSDPPPSDPARFSELQDRIDPNTANEAMLAALPSLGEKRAREIVDYRQAFARLHPDQIVFGEAGDLQQVKGIGPGIVANIEPFLIFPARSLTSRPSMK